MPHWTYDKPAIRSHGMNQPLFISDVSCEDTSCAIVLWPYMPGDDSKRIEIVGYNYEVHVFMDEHSEPLKTYVGDLPEHGWHIVGARCDQTGGHWMVDVITFDNDWQLSLTEEVAILNKALGWDAGEEANEDHVFQLLP